MIGKITLVRLGTDGFKIIKIDSTGYQLTEGQDSSEDRMKYYNKYAVGTVISFEEFFTDPDYYTKLHTIVPASSDYVVNV